MIDGFNVPDKTASKNLVISIAGVGKAGKTSVALTSEPPIAYMDLNIRDRGVIEKFPQVEIHKRKYTSSDFDPNDQDDCIQVADQFESDFYELLETDTCRSVVVDTFTDLIKIEKIAMVNALGFPLASSFKMKVVYGKLDKLIRAGFDSNKNVILVHEVKPEFVKGEWNGDFYRDSYPKLENRVEVEIFLWTHKEKESHIVTDVEYRQMYTINGRKKLDTGFIVNEFDDGLCLQGGLPKVMADILGGDEDDYNYTTMEE